MTITIVTQYGNETINGSAADDDVFVFVWPFRFPTYVNSDLASRGGYDVLDLSNLDPIYRVNFHYSIPGYNSGVIFIEKPNISGWFGEITFYNIQSIIGSQGDDVFYSASPRGIFNIAGMGGNDTINGIGSQNNQADYSSALTGVNVNLAMGTATDGLGGIDTLIDVVRVRGSRFDDTLTGGTKGDIFSASGGDDTIDGGIGSNYLDYDSAFGTGPVVVGYGSSGYSGTIAKADGGIDSFANIRGILGSGDNDTLVGSDDTSANLPYAILLRGRAGDDLIDGRKSTLNAAAYFDSPTGVVIRLQTSTDGSGNWHGTASDGFQVAGQPVGTFGTDTLKNVLRAGGSAYADTITGSALNDRFDATTGSDVYNGGNGFNTLEYNSSGLTTAMSVSITVSAPGAGLFGWGNAVAIKSLGGGTDILTNINEYRGTNYNDVLTGYAYTYTWNVITLRGGAGNDTINGAGRSGNRADYSGATAAAVVDLTAGAAQDGQGGTDTLIDVRGVASSSYNDTINGSAFNDTISVAALGQHRLDGRGGANTVTYRGTDAVIIDLGDALAAPGGHGGWQGSISKIAGTDTLLNFNGAVGGGGNDTVRGTAGDDTLGGGQGNNLVDGRGGYNTVDFRSYNGAAPGLATAIDLAAGTATNPWGGTDTLVHIQGAYGSQFADRITGLALAGTRSFIRADGGDDTIIAGSADTLITASYSSSLAGVVVDLKQGKTLDDGWFGGQDTLVNIQSVRASAFADSITGSDRADTIEGGLGNDTIDGGAGRDVVILNLTSTAATWTRDAASKAWTVTSADGTDTLRNVETLQFTDRSIALPGASVANDLDGAGVSDILWRYADGTVARWAMAGFNATGGSIASVATDWTLRGAADFNGDGCADLIWRGPDGSVAQWQMNGNAYIGGGTFAKVGLDWKIAGMADMDGDGRADILWRNDDGSVAVWRMDGTGFLGGGGIGNAGTAWKIAGLADFDGDGRADILWRHDDGTVAVWRMDGTSFLAGATIAAPGAAWKIAGTGDVDGDGRADLVWRHDDGTVAVWTMDGLTPTGGATIAAPGTAWSIAAVGDYDGDARADLLWRHVDGSVSLWLLDGLVAKAGASLGNPGNAWSVIG